ncbi:MAG: hypothetical protein QM736_22895 [Vicinamibacterales bacterium]
MMRACVRSVCGVLACAVMLASIGCGDDSPTTPSTSTPTSSTELFTGTLSPGGSSFYSFTVTNAGTVSITLASLASSRVGLVLPSRLTIGLGVPNGFGCATTSTVDTAPGLTAQLTASGAKDNIYCVNLADPGVLTGDVLFVIRIVHT